MVSVPFDPACDLIFVAGRVRGRLRECPLRLVLDTGASQTLLRPEVLDVIGYTARDGDTATRVTTAVGEEQGFCLHVASFEALDHEVPAFQVAVHDLPPVCDFDGLLGLNFLRRFNYEIRSREGQIRVEPA